MPEGAILPPIDEYLARLGRVEEEVRTIQRAATLQPPIPMPWTMETQGALGPYGIYTYTVSATFLRAWGHIARRVPNLGILLDVPLTVDAGCSGEIRLVNVFGSGNTPSTVVPFAAALTPSFRWLHGVPLWGEGYFAVEVRKTAGAGNVYVYTPWASFTPPDRCTVGGT